MRTIEYPYYQPPFPEFNVAQEAVVPYLDKDVNLVVAFQTAVGKTVLAECCFGFHLSQEDGCRVAYVSPYRSLSAEKFESWSNDGQFSKCGVMLSTGDHVASSQEYEETRMAVVTSEAFDSRTRAGRYEDWLKSMACVAFDEAHMIGDASRGSAVEASLMRFTAINPEARLVLLSATMGNAMEVAKWLKSLNGKQTKCITSDWRPREVKCFYHVVEKEEKIPFVVQKAAEQSSGKTLIFVHSKIVGREIEKQLKQNGISTAFHNAGLSRENRAKIERQFNDGSSGLNVLVSTSTLGAGVNVGEL
jgi:replicative superfamily II helicase